MLTTCENTDFHTYGHELDALQISQDLRTGAGTKTMAAAADAWSQLGSTLGKLESTYREMIAKLLVSWTGPAALEMAAQLTLYAEGISGYGITAQHTGELLRSISNAYRRARNRTVAPEEIHQNRLKLKSLQRDNTGTQSKEIAACEERERQWQTQNLEAITTYRGTAVFVASQLLSFTSLQPTKGVSPVKRACRETPPNWANQMP